MRSLRGNEQGSGNVRLRVFVDANTIVSGLIFEGNEALLLKLGAVGACKLVTTRYVLDEVGQVLRSREFRLGQEEVASLLSFMNRCTLVYENVRLEELQEYQTRLDDKKDAHVLAAFERLRCDILVTGDKELLRKVRGAKTTRQALEILLGKS